MAKIIKNRSLRTTLEKKIMTKKATMKGIFAALAITMAASNTAQAQQTGTITPKESKFYVSVQGGYNLPMAQQNGVLGVYNETDLTNGDTRYEYKSMSLGKGFNAGINVGYMFTKNIGAEIGANYLMGSEYTGTYKDETDPTYSYSQKVSAKMIQIKPAAVFRVNYDKISPYAKVGLVIGLGSKIKSNENWQDTSNGYNSERSWEYNKGIAFGMHGAIGAEFAINDMIGIFGEITGTGLTYAPEKGKMTSRSINGVDQMPNYPTRTKEIDFQDGSFVDDGGNNVARKEAKQYMPFSSIGLNIGVRFKF